MRTRRLRRLRPAAAASLTAFLLVTAVPAAQATPVYLELSAALEIPVDIADLTTPPPEAAGQGGGTAPACAPSRFEADPVHRLFRFQDSADASGCLGVRLNVTLPADARHITVRFTADRTVDANGGTLGPPTLEQEIRLRAGPQSVVNVPYFDTQDPSKPPARFAFGFEAPQGAREAQLEWWFANRAAPTSAADPAGRLQAWSATVRDPVIHLDSIPLPAPVSRPLGGQVQQTSYLAGYTADVWVPPEHRDAAREGRFSLMLHVPGAVIVDRFLAPGGKDLPADRYSVGEDGGQRTLSLPGSTLREFGPGPYVLQVQAAETLDVQPTMAALTLLALLMPPAALGLAIQRLRQRIPEKYLQDPGDLEAEGLAR